jgi:hypothetical protein
MFAAYMAYSFIAFFHILLLVLLSVHIYIYIYIYGLIFVCCVLCILFHCVVLCTVCADVYCTAVTRCKPNCS